MNNLPARLYTAAQSRELDRFAIEVYGLDGFTLMRRAGEAAFDAMLRRWGDARRLAVVCGGGNNGGDGYVLAARARRIGIEVDLLLLAEPGSDDARAARAQYLDSGGRVLKAAPRHLSGAELIVDAVFGTGLSRAAEGEWAEMLAAINRSPAPVLALDIPSGLDSNSGLPLGETVKADVTVTFIGVKIGLLTGSGPEYAGEVLFDDLGLPREVYNDVAPAAMRLTAGRLKWPWRPLDAHKGRAGHALAIGGDFGMAGAAMMAARAAARVGAGLTTVATRTEHARLLPLSQPEIMTAATETPQQLEAATRRATALALGPGLGVGEWGAELFAQAMAADLPLVVDADGLNLLAREPLRPDHRRDNWVLTPHPGEAARLLDCSVREIQSDRLGSVKEIARHYGGVCVLKGPGTLVSEADGVVDLCDRGNPGMASGGMGDVLTGAIAGLMAQGLSSLEAARLGVWLHSTAADEEAKVAGEIGMLATDLLPHMRRLLKRPDS